MKKEKKNKLHFLDNLENNPLKYYKFSKKVGSLNKNYKKINVSFLSNYTIVNKWYLYVTLNNLQFIDIMESFEWYSLSLLFKTLNLKKGDEVIMQSLTFSADGFALLQSGAKIIFVDCCTILLSASIFPDECISENFGAAILLTAINPK